MWLSRKTKPIEGPITEEWEGAIGCEGGPVLIANADDFRHWTGTDPLPNEDRKELHLWSGFTSELPEKFRPDGPVGHQYVPRGSFDELALLRDELPQHVRDRCRERR